MFYVKLYRENHCFVNAPFNDRDSAIKYFNFRIDHPVFDFEKFDRIEILNDNCVLFDYEV